MVLAVAIARPGGRHPRQPATFRLRADGARAAPDAGRRCRQSGHAVRYLDGEALWQRKDGSAGKSCADCHGAVARSMKGVAARYPAFDRKLGRPIDLEGRINACRTSHQRVERPGLRKQGAAVADRLCRPPIEGGCRSPSPTMRRPVHFVTAGRIIFERRQGPAQPLLRAMP